MWGNIRKQGENGKSILTTSHFGEHLMLDGYGGTFELLNDRSLVLQCLNELPTRLEMRKLAEPVVYFAPGNGGKDPGGWSGVVVIAESHVSIHTFPARGFVSIDVYTCKNGMDVKYIESYFQGKFKLKDIETNFIKRGTKYPKENLF
jgi:S-adenosylmethionine decarboxylase